MVSGETNTDRRPSLSVLHSGDAALHRRVIPVGDELCIGRVGEDGVNLAVDDRLLSRKHATIRPLGRSDTLELLDHESRNGSFVAGRRVERAHLEAGTILRLGVSVFEVTLDRRESLPEVDSGTRDALVGRSNAFLDMMAAVEEVAGSDEPVVLYGEAGTGKSLVAAEIHRRSGREGSLVVVGCRGAGMPVSADDLLGTSEQTGYLGSAAGGTLVLEEVDLLVPELQELVLEVCETGRFTPRGGESQPFSARVVASTSANLSAAVAVGAFSEELHGHLRGRVIELPALRQRRTDIPALVRHFFELEESRRTFDWSATFLEKLLLYDWPSNARELRAVARRLTMVEEDVTTLRSAHLPKEIQKGVRLQTEDALRASAISYQAVPSREELQGMLERYEGDVQRVAEHYDKDRRHVYRWLLRHDLSAQDFRS